MRRVLWFALVMVITLGVGLWLGSGPGSPTPQEQARSSVDAELERTMLPFRVAFRILLGLIVLVTLGGMGWGGIRWLLRRADTVYPDQAGLYPIREERVGGAKVFHDPNRTLAGTTVYGARAARVQVHQPLPEGQAQAQQQITAQAQVAQALRAAVSGTSPLSTAQPLPLDALQPRRVSRPLPEVQALELEPSHIERLLIEDGEHAN
jgi:hypothetical protein